MFFYSSNNYSEWRCQNLLSLKSWQNCCFDLHADDPSALIFFPLFLYQTMILLFAHKDSIVCFSDWSLAKSLPKDICPLMFSEKTVCDFIPIWTGHLVDYAAKWVIDQATHYKLHSPVTQHQAFKAYRKNIPKTSTPSRVPLGQDEKQIHIYQFLNKKTINHWKYLMQTSKECLLKANSMEHRNTG